jgi:hypothetical protein
MLTEFGMVLTSLGMMDKDVLSFPETAKNIFAIDSGRIDVLSVIDN